MMTSARAAPTRAEIDTIATDNRRIEIESNFMAYSFLRHAVPDLSGSKIAHWERGLLGRGSKRL